VYDSCAEENRHRNGDAGTFEPASKVLRTLHIMPAGDNVKASLRSEHPSLTVLA